jgi:hypothetical protein
MESTKSKRVWHKGPPPHVGWWNASFYSLDEVWRWWDGEKWSIPSETNINAGYAARQASIASSSQREIKWNDYYPEGARVPRIDPGQS